MLPRHRSAPILTPSHSQAIPPPSRLEATCHQMLLDEEYCVLVGFVEKWSERQDPTPAARLAQAEALLRLRLMDKAWVRLTALTDEGLCGVKPHVLSARMFIDRGWHSKARKVAQEGLERSPDHAELLALLDEANTVGEPLDTSKADDADAATHELMPLAEHFMAQGAFVRARSLLERVRRVDPEHRRALELLRAIDGRFGVEESLARLVELHGPAVPSLPDLTDDADHTESANLDTLPHAFERDEPDARFPALFRGMAGPHEDTTTLGDDSEVTAVSSLAEMRSLLDAAEAHEATDAGEDTQIMRVVHRGGMEPVEGAVHKETPEPDASFNLADFRREMGMTPRALGSDLDFQGPEDEDESVVVRTTATAGDAPSAGDPSSGADTEITSASELGGARDGAPLADPRPAVPEPDTPRASKALRHEAEAEARAAAAQGPSEDDVWADLSEGNQAPVRVVEAAPAKAPPPPPPSRAPVVDADEFNPMVTWPAWVAVMVLMLGLAFLIFGGLVLMLLVT